MVSPSVCSARNGPVSPPPSRVQLLDNNPVVGVEHNENCCWRSAVLVLEALFGYFRRAVAELKVLVRKALPNRLIADNWVGLGV